MIQFGNAMYRNDFQNSQIMDFIKQFQANPESPESAIDTLRGLVRNFPEARRSLLVYVRMFFWGYISIDDALNDVAHALTIEKFNGLDIFERIEIANCFGPKLTSNLLNIDISEVRKYIEIDELEININDQFESNEIWCYVPPPTGFFSVVENILLARFFCLIQRKTFKLDENYQNWWRYPIGFKDIFTNCFDSKTICTSNNVKYLQWNVVRDVIANASVDIFNVFSRFKKMEYLKIKKVLSGCLTDTEDVFGPLSESALFYIRGGDKLVLETISPPTNVIEKDFELLFKLSDRFLVLSDDYQLAENFKSKFGANKVENITKEIFNGYFVQNNSVDDVQAIIRNYLTLSSVKYSMSCPSSNLVNSAHWSNEILDSKIHLSSTPLLRYAYL